MLQTALSVITLCVLTDTVLNFSCAAGSARKALLFAIPAMLLHFKGAIRGLCFQSEVHRMPTAGGLPGVDQRFTACCLFSLMTPQHPSPFIPPSQSSSV